MLCMAHALLWVRALSVKSMGSNSPSGSALSGNRGPSKCRISVAVAMSRAMACWSSNEAGTAPQQEANSRNLGSLLYIKYTRQRA